MPARLAVMDEVGIFAQVVYPNAAGFGGQRFGGLADPVLKNLCATLYNDAMVLANLVISGLLERHPRLQFVSVESGIGWIPFVLEALTHQLGETAPGALDHLSLSPLEYFRRQLFACFWFEKDDVARTVATLGADRILFETDFPHPTCLYPDSMAAAAPGLAGLDDADRRRILHDNAAALYRIPTG